MYNGAASSQQITCKRTQGSSRCSGQFCFIYVCYVLCIMVLKHRSRTKPSICNTNLLPICRRFKNIKQFNRAIPHEDYITLGTIRYGIKFGSRSNMENISNFTTLSIGEANDVMENGYHSIKKDVVDAKIGKTPDLSPVDNDSPNVANLVMPNLTQFSRKAKSQGELY